MSFSTVRDIHISIVSHGQLGLIVDLLSYLSSQICIDRLQISLTLNIHERTVGVIDKYQQYVSVIENKSPKGFAENHNYAFNHCPVPSERLFFFVLNPDITIDDTVIADLVKVLENDVSLGVVGPNVISGTGKCEDSARTLPTWFRLVKKLFGHNNQWVNELNNNRYYPDWIAGMCMGFHASTFEVIKGFDEKFFLYYEDVDICSRLWLLGRRVMVVTSVSIVHDARRDSRKKLNYLLWHMTSLLRFLFSDTYRKVKKFHDSRNS